MLTNIISDQQEDAGFKHYVVFGNEAPWLADDDHTVECRTLEEARKLQSLIENLVREHDRG